MRVNAVLVNYTILENIKTVIKYDHILSVRVNVALQNYTILVNIKTVIKYCQILLL